MKDNVQYFDMGNNPTMGQITGEGALSSVVIDVVMRPLNFPNDYKPGQLGYGANWWDQEFGYSNWFKYSVLNNTSGVGRTSSDWKGGDINVNLVPTPLPAGLPLVLTAFGGLYVLRRRQKAA
ncbi:MAG: VPLPA-CTERM sorting domain-containing protein [Tateyamaria sp.]|uniref:VPLPA-CTERM sorting domain-containing protein n=1 Tax=Tateyamaria sp. TaxID=1929288 RepID=UPI0032755273